MPGTTDTVKAKLTPGEFVIRKEAVDMIGVPMLNKLNNMPEEGGHSAIDRIIDMATMSNMKMMYGGGMVKPNYAGGGMVQQYGHGGSVNKMMGYQKGGQLKAVPEGNPGLGKLPEMVRNRMGYMQDGGMVDNSLMGMRYGGMAKKKKMMGYEDGGEVLSKVLRGVGRDLDRGGIDQDGDMINFKRVLSIPAEQVGGGEGLRYYAGEGMSDRLQMSRDKAYMDAVQKMVSAEQDSIPMAMIDEYLAPKKRSLRDLLPFQEGGPVEEGIPLPPQPKDPLQIDARQADPSMYEGSQLGVRDQAMMLQDSIEQDTVNKARKTLQLLKLKGLLEGAESLDSETGNPVLDREKDAGKEMTRQMLQRMIMMRGMPF